MPNGLVPRRGIAPPSPSGASGIAKHGAVSRQARQPGQGRRSRPARKNVCLDRILPPALLALRPELQHSDRLPVRPHQPHSGRKGRGRGRLSVCGGSGNRRQKNNSKWFPFRTVFQIEIIFQLRDLPPLTLLFIGRQRFSLSLSSQNAPPSCRLSGSRNHPLLSPLPSRFLPQRFLPHARIKLGASRNLPVSPPNTERANTHARRDRRMPAPQSATALDTSAGGPWAYNSVVTLLCLVEWSACPNIDPLSPPPSLHSAMQVISKRRHKHVSTRDIQGGELGSPIASLPQTYADQSVYH